MHGEGELHWPDGRLYRGSFRQNQQLIRLRMLGIARIQRKHLRGQLERWQNERIRNSQVQKCCVFFLYFNIFYFTISHPRGLNRYASGDVYEGNFQDGQPHGHGTLKRGHFLTSAAHVYVGQSDSGQKNGYRVMDDIVIGK